MKYIFRGHTIFEYLPGENRIKQHKIHGKIPAFDYCRFVDEDYKLLSEFFNRAFLHTQGKDVDLNDIVVN